MHHTSDSGYQRYANDWLGRGETEFFPFQPDVLSVMAGHHRAIMDTLFSAVGYGMLSRFPEIRLATIECGSTWITRLVEDMLDAHGRVPHMFAEPPSTFSKGSCTWHGSGRIRYSPSST
jgi:hypothetical protein